MASEMSPLTANPAGSMCGRVTSKRCMDLLEVSRTTHDYHVVEGASRAPGRYVIRETAAMIAKPPARDS